MDSMKLASGDNKASLTSSPRECQDDKELNDDGAIPTEEICVVEDVTSKRSEITAQTIDENEKKLKERISQCKNIIDSLKFELREEKAKLERENKKHHNVTNDMSISSHMCHDVVKSDNLYSDMPFNSSMISASVDSKLFCDENLMEYEKQLQRYQNTLHVAQNEKKNAIRKQMLVKAYKLKLLEVENQCNIELLRVKQSLQCLEPLQMIAEKWKTSEDNTLYDLNRFELLPSYLEVPHSISETNFLKDDGDAKDVNIETAINNEANLDVYSAPT